MSRESNRPGHIRGATCPCCQDKMVLTIDPKQIFSMIWECETCGEKFNHATGVSMTTVVTLETSELKYATRRKELL
jgi:ribosomal protein L37AE/L43A